MKFEVSRTSGTEEEYELELNTLEELLVFVRKNGQVVIIPPVPEAGPWRAHWELEIYDDWRE